MLRDPMATLPSLFRTTMRGRIPSRDEIRTILKIAFLTAEIDLDEDPDELQLLRTACRMLFQLAGYPPEQLPIVSPLPLPEDPEARSACIHDLAQRLPIEGARELAFGIANLFVVEDLELAPIEQAFLEELRRELHIDPARAAELATA